MISKSTILQFKKYKKRREKKEVHVNDGKMPAICWDSGKEAKDSVSKDIKIWDH